MSGTEAEVYAESVVRDVLNCKEGTVWRGAFAGTLRWLKVLMPGFVMVSFFSFLFSFFFFLFCWSVIRWGCGKGSV